MKKFLLAILLLAAALCLCGCDLWINGSYYAEKANAGENLRPMIDQAEVSDAWEMQSVLTQMVESGTQSSVFYISDMSDIEGEQYIQNAISHVMQINPIGAYAVRDVQYEFGMRAGRSAIAVTVTYHHNRSEILRIAQADDMESVISRLVQALNDCDSNLVLRVGNYVQPDIIQLVRDYVEQNPDICMEMPQITATFYPQDGEERVLEVLFSYQNNLDDLRDMQERVAAVFASAELYVSEDALPREKYSQMYSFLMERYDYVVETSVTPAYSLLRYGVGDSKAFAMVYAAMCRRAGLSCQMISGTREGQPWYWNLIAEDGVYYHVDLLRASENGQFSAYLPEEMGGYVWDYAVE